MGVVTEVGPEVSNFKVGDRAGVGCMVNSCGSCDACKEGEEQYCDGTVLTYDSGEWLPGDGGAGGRSLGCH